MINEQSNIFINKKILIYGLAKSGISSFNFLKKHNKVFLFDDSKKLKLSKLLKKKILSINEIKKKEFDLIIISPGIDIYKCKLKNFLKDNKDNIYTDLDVFYSFYKNNCITITGTNGKSTTCKLLYEIFKKQKIDVKLAGNIGYPILSVKNIRPRTLFVIEASSYQLDYSRLFKTKIAVILNIKPDHLERHKTLKNYADAKLKLIKGQLPGSLAFINRHDLKSLISLKKNNYKCRIIKVNSKKKNKVFYNKKNNYFSSASNKENLSFVLEIAKKFKIKKKIINNVIKNFKGLKYRQQVIYQNKNLSIINDSKSTSYSSTIEMLKKTQEIYWLIGGIPKKGDKFVLPKVYYKNIRAYIFGKNYKKFYKDLKNKIKLSKFQNLKKALNEIFKNMKIEDKKKKIILFSPSAASFDTFKNFEDRGMYFNKLIRKHIYGK